MVVDYLIIKLVNNKEFLSNRRKRLHELLLALIGKESNFELIDDNSTEFTTRYSDEENKDFSKVIERNRKILKKYQSLIRTAVTLDALMDSENEENYKIKK